jgi:hypothetical protein
MKMKRAADIAPGSKFGLLTNIKEEPSIDGVRLSRVRCDCGVEKVVRTSNLRNGSITSCGCQKGLARRKVPNPGDKYNFWTFLGGQESVNGQMYGLFKCVCGKERSVQIRSVKAEKSTSCGCQVNPAKKHGDAGSAIHQLWKRIKGRCYNKNNPDYKDYGGRGIGVYPGWINDFSAFKEYIHSNLGERPSPEFSLDRMDNNKSYQPGNLRWADKYQQANNRRNKVRVTLFGKEETIASLAARSGISYETLHHRITAQGLSAEDAISMPTQKCPSPQKIESSA